MLDREQIEGWERVRSYRLGECTVEQGDGWTRTTLPGGKQVTASHDEAEGQAATAAEHGLDVRGMNAGHDLAHGILAALLGLPASPTLAGVASGKHWPHWFREEAAVLALQSYAAAAGVDLETVARRLSDERD